MPLARSCRAARSLALPLAAAALAFPCASRAGIHADPVIDVTHTLAVPALPAPSVDFSPSLVADPVNTSLAWARTPVNPTQSDQSLVLLARVDAAGAVATQAQLPVGSGVIYGAAAAHDGVQPVVAFTLPTPGNEPGADVVLWPTGGTPLTVTALGGVALDLSIAPRVVPASIPMVVSYLNAAPIVPEGEWFVLQTDRTYTTGVVTSLGRDPATPDGRAARLPAGGPLFLLFPPGSANAVLRDETGGVLASVPSSGTVVGDLVVRPTSEVLIATQAGQTSAQLSLYDASTHVLRTARPGPLPLAGSLRELALAADARQDAWLVALTYNTMTQGYQLEVFTRDAGGYVAVPVSDALDVCDHLRAAEFAADPDAIAVTARCSTDPAGLESHVYLWILHRDPDATTDAGTDASTDAAGDATVEDATTGDGAVGDATASDAGGDAAEVPTGPGVKFRGSGCACATAPGASPRAGDAALVALVLAAALARRAGRRRAS